MRFVFFFKLIVAGFFYISSTLLKLRTKQREGFSTLGQREEKPSLWMIMGPVDHSPCSARFADVTNQQNESKKSKNSRGNKQA